MSRTRSRPRTRSAQPPRINQNHRKKRRAHARQVRYLAQRSVQHRGAADRIRSTDDALDQRVQPGNDKDGGGGLVVGVVLLLLSSSQIRGDLRDGLRGCWEVEDGEELDGVEEGYCFFAG